MRTASLTTPYDGNGQPQTASLTRYYFGGALETTGSSVKKYYSFAGQSVAMKEGSTFKYFLSDHLGSTSLVLSATGTILEQQRYLPFGQPRAMSPAITSTDFTYTGQRDIPNTGLMDYKARFYSPALGRFVQPDSLIPGMANPQSWNRFSYTLNNPIRFNDPTGHCAVDGDNWCYEPTPPTKEKQVPPIPPKETGHLDRDEFGIDILKRYLSGGGDWYITNDEQWSTYMANNPTLKEDLELRAIENAQFMQNNGYSSIIIDERYPMEIENGEAMIGYQYLHGTNNDVGGFQRLGFATMSPTSDGGSDVTLKMSYTWNDVIDPNPQYLTDVIKSSIGEIITLGKATPYTIRISWTQTIVVHLDSNGAVIP